MTVQQEAISLIDTLPEDSVKVLIELIKRMTPNQSKPRSSKRTLGIAKGKYNIPDNIDECNGEIAEMFGLNE